MQFGNLEFARTYRITFEIWGDASHAGAHRDAKMRVNPAYGAKPDNRDLQASDFLAENPRPSSGPYPHMRRSNSPKPGDHQAESELRDRTCVRVLDILDSDTAHPLSLILLRL